jgi:hypothetical protein
MVTTIQSLFSIGQWQQHQDSSLSMLACSSSIIAYPGHNHLKKKKKIKPRGAKI